jgi:tetratricopeptide (TPR) repeat protein
MDEPRIRNIPPIWAAFLGRDVERSQIKDFLTQSTCPIMIVHGQRGIGKSSLVAKVANDSLEHFSSVVWLDCSNALELFEKMDESSNFSLNEKFQFTDDDLSETNRTLINRLWQKKESVSSKVAGLLANEMINNDTSNSHLPCLLIIDDFDENNFLTLRLCEYIEQFVQYPNKIIVTSRLPDNSFGGLGYVPFEIGLLHKEDVDSIVKQHLSRLDTKILVNGSVEETCKYVLNLSGGLSEFISRCVIPATIQQGLLVGRDSEWDRINQAFANNYLLEQDQPKSINGYQMPANSQDIEPFLKDLFDNDIFTGFVLWRWFNLDVDNDGALPKSEKYFQDDLALVLGINTKNNELESRFNSSLLKLYKHRLVSREIAYKVVDEKSQGLIQTPRWILLPVISIFLQKHWPMARHFWVDEAALLQNFVDCNIDQPEKIEPHYKRIFKVISWCYENGFLEQVIALGFSVVKVIEKIIDANQLPKELIIYDICRITADALEKRGVSENWKKLRSVLLILAKLYSLAKADNKTKTLEYAEKAYKLSLENKDSDWPDAGVFTAKSYIYIGDFDRAQQILNEVFSNLKQVKGNWADAAYLLATILSQEKNSPEAFMWYQKIIEAISYHKKIDIALKSATNAACFCSTTDNLSDSVMEILVRTSETIRKNRPYIEKYPKFAAYVLAHCAAAYEKHDDLKNCKKLLIETIDICKEFKLLNEGFYDPLSRRLDYLNQLETRTSLFDEIKPFTVFDSDEEVDMLLSLNCPLCKLKIESPLEILSCPSCSQNYHAACISESGFSSCPICGTEFNRAKKEE